MGKFVKIAYLIIILLFAISSTAVTWANNSVAVLSLEFVVNTGILLGVVLSIRKINLKWWALPMVFIFCGEIFLLATDPRVGAVESIQWAVILFPSLFFHLQVSGQVKYRNIESKEKR
jgi:hypothetical protein